MGRDVTIDSYENTSLVSIQYYWQQLLQRTVNICRAILSNNENLIH